MVLVIDKRMRPRNAISEDYARILLYSKQAVIHKRYPFTIRLRNNNKLKFYHYKDTQRIELWLNLTSSQL